MAMRRARQAVRIPWLAQVEALAHRITGDDTLRMPEIVDADRARVLAEYAMGASPAPLGRERDSLPTDQADAGLLRGILAKEELWRHSGFQLRHLLSRRELDLLTESDRATFGRNMSFYYANSTRYQKFGQFMDLGWAATIIITVFIGISAYLLFYYDLNFDILLLFTVYSALAAYGLLITLLAALLRRSSLSPYGLTMRTAIVLAISGPFRREIKDYSREEERKR